MSLKYNKIIVCTLLITGSTQLMYAPDGGSKPTTEIQETPEQTATRTARQKELNTQIQSGFKLNPAATAPNHDAQSTAEHSNAPTSNGGGFDMTSTADSNAKNYTETSTSKTGDKIETTFKNNEVVKQVTTTHDSVITKEIDHATEKITTTTVTGKGDDSETDVKVTDSKGKLLARITNEKGFKAEASYSSDGKSMTVTSNGFKLEVTTTDGKTFHAKKTDVNDYISNHVLKTGSAQDVSSIDLTALKQTSLILDSVRNMISDFMKYFHSTVDVIATSFRSKVKTPSNSTVKTTSNSAVSKEKIKSLVPDILVALPFDIIN